MPFCAGLFYRYYDGGASSFVYPTVFIHGFGGTHLSWPPILRRIAGQRIFALDLPGHGLSKIAARCSAKAIVHYLHKFTIELGIFHFALVGHSMGGAIAYEFARSFPDHIRGLVLISSGRMFNNMDALQSAFKNEKSMDPAIELLSQKGFYSGFPRSHRMKILSPLRKTRPRVLQADLDVCASFSAGCSHEDFSFPIQLITGREDQLVVLNEVKKLKYCLPNASLQIINDCGHMIVFEKDEEVRTILDSFLKQVTKIDR